MTTQGAGHSVQGRQPISTLSHGSVSRAGEVTLNKGRVIMLGMARPGFDTELALHMFHDSVIAVEKLGYDSVRPDGLAGPSPVVTL